MKEYFCWKCKKQMPFLEEDEWRQIGPLFYIEIKARKDYMKKTRLRHIFEVDPDDIPTEKDKPLPLTTIMFEKLTGVPNIPFTVSSHHRLADWGQECPECGRLLRTPKARFCASCGWIPYLFS